MKKLLTIAFALACSASGPGRAEDKVDFAKQIQPILRQNCVKCHGPEKQKGKLRLDSKEVAMKGGKDGVVIVAGDADKSELYRRIILPKGHDDIMPNEGDPLSKEQTDLVRVWINQGAEWPETAAANETAPSNPLAGLPTDFKPSANEAKASSKLAQLGIDVRPIAINVHWTEANFRPQGTNINDAAIAPLKDVTSLTDLNLAGTKISDAGLAAVAALTNLTRLHLELTPITDPGLAHLKKLSNLNYLNLYGTAVTDAGLEHLKGLRNLRHLYVWQTKVTDDGVKKLKAVLTNVEISTGTELNVVAKKEESEKPDEKKEEKK
jgi:mono/diheme cytochrome c family protein